MYCWLYSIHNKFTDGYIDFLTSLSYSYSRKGLTIMLSVLSAITNTVPITQFNRGRAGKIFEEVKQSGAKVVMKNNTAECVLLSPEEYVRLMDEVNDARLLAMASERMAHYDPDSTISGEEMNRRLGVKESDLADFDEVEIE